MKSMTQLNVKQGAKLNRPALVKAEDCEVFRSLFASSGAYLRGINRSRFEKNHPVCRTVRNCPRNYCSFVPFFKSTCSS